MGERAALGLRVKTGWAAAVVLSRAFRDTPPSHDEEEWALVPVLDSANHRPRGGAPEGRIVLG